MKRILFIIAVLVLVPLVAADNHNVAPLPPHQFYGDITINDQPAPAGTQVTARVNGNVYGTTLVETPGEYGTGDRIFYVETADGSDFSGRSIAFYVDDELASTYSPYENGQSTQLDLSITREETQTPPSSGGGGGGGSSGGGGGGGSVGSTSTTTTTTNESTNSGSSSNQTQNQSATTCEPDWQCSEWTACVNGFENRRCIDANQCGTEDGRPAETQACESAPVEQESEGLFNQLTGAVVGGGVAAIGGAVALLIIIAALVGVAVWYRKRD